MCAHLQSLQEAKGSQSSSSWNQAEGGIVQHFTIVIPAQKHTKKWYKCLSWILSVFSPSVSLPPSFTPARFTQAHSWGAETNSVHTIRCLRRQPCFPHVKEIIRVISLPLRSELRAATLTQMASSPLMRARKKYSGKEVWRLKEQAVIYQAENHSSFTGEHVNVVRRWLPCAAIICLVMILLTPEQSCTICLLSSLVDADFEHCLKWQATRACARTHAHTHTHTHTHTALQNQA